MIKKNRLIELKNFLKKKIKEKNSLPTEHPENPASRKLLKSKNTILCLLIMKYLFLAQK